MKIFKKSFVILTILTVFWLSSIAVFAEENHPHQITDSSTSIVVKGTFPQMEWKLNSQGRFYANAQMTGTITIASERYDLNGNDPKFTVDVELWCDATKDGRPDNSTIEGDIYIICEDSDNGYCLDDVNPVPLSLTINSASSINFVVNSHTHQDSTKHGFYIFSVLNTTYPHGIYITYNNLSSLGISVPTYNDGSSNNTTSSQRAETEEEREERLYQEYIKTPYVKETIDSLGKINRMPANSTDTMNFDFEHLACLTPGFRAAMIAHPNMTYVMTMKYNGVKYRFVIPAGYDVNKLFDENGFSGVLYLNMMLNGTVVQ